MAACPGCGSTKLTDLTSPHCPDAKYCDDCYRAVLKQTDEAEWKFRFERELRTPSAEYWTIKHPDVFGRIAQAFAFLTDQREVYVHVYLFPNTLNWEEGIPVILPNGVEVKETYLEILNRVILSHVVLGLTGHTGTIHKFDSVSIWCLGDPRPIHTRSWPPLSPFDSSITPPPSSEQHP